MIGQQLEPESWLLSSVRLINGPRWFHGSLLFLGFHGSMVRPDWLYGSSSRAIALFTRHTQIVVQVFRFECVWTQMAFNGPCPGWKRHLVFKCFPMFPKLNIKTNPAAYSSIVHPKPFFFPSNILKRRKIEEYSAMYLLNLSFSIFTSISAYCCVVS